MASGRRVRGGGSGHAECEVGGLWGWSGRRGAGVVGGGEAGDEVARALGTDVGRAFGQGLANLVAIFDPEIIIVGGGLGSVGESIVGPARRVLIDAVYGGKVRVPPTVRVAELGPAAGAIGAALQAAGEVR